jgi:KH domain
MTMVMACILMMLTMMACLPMLQMKIVVPNVTVGMIIGRGGCYIKQIKDDTGAYVQISQKAPDTLLVERVVTIGGFY